jgi:hypothetical protein
LAVYAACIATFLPIGGPTAQAIQCVAAPTSQKHWTYRLIDGRKCWYEGKHMISKSMLQWSPQAPAARVNSGEAPIRILTVKSSNPLDAQASFPDESDSFESRWRARAILD